jgi:hypothetical protein
VVHAADGLPDSAHDPPSVTKPVGTHSEILAHPLFYKTRAPYVPPPRPPPAPPKTVVSAAAADPGIALGGGDARGSKKGHLFSKGGATGAWIVEGESFMGWKVQSIDAGGAKLQQADQTIELQLYAKR